MIPEDPSGYAITYTDDGAKFKVTRLLGSVELGVYDTRVEAVEAAEADRLSA